MPLGLALCPAVTDDALLFFCNSFCHGATPPSPVYNATHPGILQRKNMNKHVHILLAPWLHPPPTEQMNENRNSRLTDTTREPSLFLPSFERILKGVGSEFEVDLLLDVSTWMLMVTQLHQDLTWQTKPPQSQKESQGTNNRKTFH